MRPRWGGGRGGRKGAKERAELSNCARIMQIMTVRSLRHNGENVTISIEGSVLAAESGGVECAFCVPEIRPQKKTSKET